MSWYLGVVGGVQPYWKEPDQQDLLGLNIIGWMCSWKFHLSTRSNYCCFQLKLKIATCSANQNIAGNMEEKQVDFCPQLQDSQQHWNTLHLKAAISQVSCHCMSSSHFSFEDALHLHSKVQNNPCIVYKPRVDINHFIYWTHTKQPGFCERMQCKERC